MSTYKDVALKYWEKGYVPIPINPQSKAPYMKEWANYSYDKMSRETVEGYIAKYPNANVGLVMGHQVAEGFRIISIDIDDDSILKDVESAVGHFTVAKKGKKGLTIFLRAAMSFSVGSKKFKRLGPDGKKLPKPSVEILGLKTQTVVPPSMHPETKQPYFWVQDDLLDVEFLSLPEFTEGMFLEIEAICASDDKHFKALNTMTWLGVGGGGDTHDVCVAAAGYLVSRGWKDEDIHRRIERAKAEACERNGDVYDWKDATGTIQEWIDSARAKGMADRAEAKKSRPPKLERVAAAWAIEYLGGKDHVAQDDSGVLRRYTDGYWPALDIEQLKQTIFHEFPEISMSECSNAVGVIASTVYRPNFGKSAGLTTAEDPKRWKVCLLNGTLDLMTGQLMKHDHEDEIKHQLDFEWPDSDECPVFEKFIDEMFVDSAEKKQCVLEFWSYTLIPDNSLQKFLVMIGKGGNGKGTLTRLWSSMLDSSAISSVPINELNNERKLTSLVDKLVNFSSESSRFDKMADDQLKRITGGDRVTVRRLYQEARDVELFVRMVLSVNDMPSTNDSSDALRRRMIMISCLNAPKTPDPKLDGKLRKERGAVLKKYLMPTLRDLMSRGYFTIPDSSHELVNEYLKENDPIQLWLDEHTEAVKEPKDATLSMDLYAHFREFLVRVGYRYPISEMHWGKILKGKSFPSFDKWVGAHGKNYKYRMLKLKDERF